MFTHLPQPQAFLVYFLMANLWACTPVAESQAPQETQADPWSHISDTQVRDLLEKSMAAMGGLEAWKKISQLSFDKYFALYAEDGSTEMEVDQRHSYQYKPSPLIQIAWGAGDNLQEIRYDGESLSKTKGGVKDTSATRSTLEATVFSSTFVVGLPYNMLDEGAQLSYLGKDTLDTEQAVEVLQAVYSPDTYAHHTTPDIWHLYFDQESAKLVGYRVQHADHYSYVINLSDTIVDGFTFVKERESYRVDSLRNRLYLRAKYAYKEWKIEK